MTGPRYILRRTRKGRLFLRLAGDPKSAEVELYGVEVAGDTEWEAVVTCDVVFNPRRNLTVLDGVRHEICNQVGALPRIRVELLRVDVAVLGF